MELVDEITLERLRDESIVPDSVEPLCVFLSGSIIAGWGHQNSDVDVYVVTESPPDVEPSEWAPRPVDPPSIPIVIRFVDGTRWDVEYWLDAQVDQVLDKVVSADLEGDRIAGFNLTPDDKDFIYRLAIGRPVAGAEWLRRRQDALDRARYATIVASFAFNEADSFIEDAVGQLQSGDDVSAVLAVRIAFGLAVDGLLATKGELSPSPKWRARKMRRACPPEISWDDYWSLETMRDFDADDPAGWVRQVIERCQEVTLAVDLS
jgi:hypothetical protein